MLTTMETDLMDRLRRRIPQEIHSSLRTLSTNGQLECWHKWGRSSTVSEAKWLIRQTKASSLTTEGVLIALIAAWARAGESLTRVQTRILIHLEERGYPLPALGINALPDPEETPRVTAGAEAPAQILTPELSFRPATSRTTGSCQRLSTS